MMGLIAAIALAALGTVAIVAYVNGAEDRALAGEKVVKVLVVQSEIPAGTPAGELGDRVRLEEVAQKVKARGAVTEVTTLKDKVASATLVPGEQLVKQRFIEPTAFRARGTSVEVPDGMLQTTISLSADRAVGGVLTPGSTVAVTMSFEVDITDNNPNDGITPQNNTDKLTHTTLRKVLVTNVQIDHDKQADNSTSSNNNNDGSIEPGDAPRSDLLVTLALNDVDSERLVFAAEHGKVWLSIEPKDAPVGATKVVNVENVFQ
jgi:pilus assembly protein CpaB